MFKEPFRNKNEIEQSDQNNRYWGIVLAGGDGTRLNLFIEKLLGYKKPKQYCTFIGTRSMIKHTLDRAQFLIPKNQLFTIVNENHSIYVKKEIGDMPNETIIVQPCNRETGAGILLPVLKINHLNDKSIVAVFPSDHFISDEKKFMMHIKDAAIFVENNPDKVIIIGTKPERIEQGYGWIEPGSSIMNKQNKIIYHVNKFWEKPSVELSHKLLEYGCLLNTFVMIGTSKKFLEIIKICVPELFNVFKPILSAFGTLLEKTTIQKVFQNVPVLNFSQFVLERIPDHLCVMEIPDVYWDDWGEEERIMNDIERFNLCFSVK